MDLTESQTLELKRELSDLRAIQKTACAFSNTHGGKLIIGVDDAGDIIGIPDDFLNEAQQRLAQSMRLLSPEPFFEIKINEIEGKKIIELEVEPMMYGSLCSFQGLIYYRHGSVTERAEGAVLQELLVKRKVMDFELTLSKVGPESIDLDALWGYLGIRNPGVDIDRKDPKKYLVTIGVLQHPDDDRINNAGVVFFYPDPSKVLSQCEIKLARFKGVTPVEIIDAAFISKPMLTVLSEAEAFITRNIRNAFEFHGLERTEVLEYPRSVIREALVNAVAHRSYWDPNAVQVNIFDDRIEFISPGGLPEGLSMELLGSFSVQRNPIIYRMLRDVKRVEGLATGIPRMREALRNGNYPDPLFEELGGKFLRLTVWNRKWAGMEWLGTRQKGALEFIEKNQNMTTEDYMNMFSVSRSTANEEIRELVEKGLIQKIGRTRGTKYVRKG